MAAESAEREAKLQERLREEARQIAEENARMEEIARQPVSGEQQEPTTETKKEPASEGKEETVQIVKEPEGEKEASAEPEKVNEGEEEKLAETEKAAEADQAPSDQAPEDQAPAGDDSEKKTEQLEGEPFGRFYPSWRQIIFLARNVSTCVHSCNTVKNCKTTTFRKWLNIFVNFVYCANLWKLINLLSKNFFIRMLIYGSRPQFTNIRIYKPGSEFCLMIDCNWSWNLQLQNPLVCFSWPNQEISWFAKISLLRTKICGFTVNDVVYSIRQNALDYRRIEEWTALDEPLQLIVIIAINTQCCKNNWLSLTVSSCHLIL